MTPRQPYPGLRAFEREEADLFFGRERCIDTMLDRLASEHFLAVLGASGTGKSSLVRTGLIEALEIGLMPGGGTRWRIAIMRPGGAPFANLATALLAGGTGEPEEVALLASFLRQGPRSLDLWCVEGHLTPGTKLLLLVDQFEELFRYADHAGLDEAQAFVALLLAATHVKGPVHVVMTMRSEFLGAAALLPGLAERINGSLYLPPRMTREEMASAIIGPAQVCGFSIEPALVNRLLNDLASFAPWKEEGGINQQQLQARNADQLPLMQHGLNWLWLRASERGGSIVLRPSDYEGGEALGGTITAHAREVVAQLPDAAQPYVEKVFRALVADDSVETAVRRPARFGDLVAICASATEEVAAVVTAFRANGCNFLMPPPAMPLTEATVVDLSHESLIRQWSDLRVWFEREARAARGWKRLLEQMDQQGSGAGELLTGRDLEAVEQRWAEDPPNSAWAARYGGRFAEARTFLSISREHASHARRKARRQRLLISVAAVGSVLSVAFILLGYVSWVNSTLRTQNEALERAQADAYRQKAASDRLAKSEVEQREIAVSAQKLAEERLQEARKAAENARQSADIARRAARSLATDLVADLRNREGMRLELARDLLRQADATLVGLTQRAPGDVDLLEARAVVNLELANVHRNLFASALQFEAAETALGLYEQAFAMQLHNTDLRAGRAEAQERVGDAQRDRAPPDLNGSSRAYRASLEIRLALASEQSGNPAWRRSIAVIHDRIATLFRGQSRLDEAEKEYQIARDISTDLLRGDRDNPVWLRDLAWTLQGIAEVQRRRRRTESALGLLGEARQHFERLRAAGSGNTQALRDLSFNFLATGNVMREAGNAEAAFREYQQAWRLRERLAASDQANARWQLEAVDIRISLGEVALLLRRPDDARTQGEAALSVVRQLEERFPRETWMTPTHRRAEVLFKARTPPPRH